MTAVADDSATELTSDETVRSGLQLGNRVRGIVLSLLLLGLVGASANIGQLGRLGRITFWIVVVVATSAAVFVSLNLLVSLARRSWTA